MPWSQLRDRGDGPAEEADWEASGQWADGQAGKRAQREGKRVGGQAGGREGGGGKRIAGRCDRADGGAGRARKSWG